MLTSAPRALKLELQRRLAGSLHKAGMQINELSSSFVKETVHWFILTETTSVAVLCLCDICLLSYFLLLGLYWWWSCPLLISRNGWSLAFIQYILLFFKILMLSDPGNVDVGELAPLLARVEWESWSCPSLTDWSTQESGYCSSPGQLGRAWPWCCGCRRAGPDGAGELVSELASLPVPALTGRRTATAPHIGKTGELALMVQMPESRGLINSPTTHSQVPGYKLTHPNLHLIHELL